MAETATGAVAVAVVRAQSVLIQLVLLEKMQETAVLAQVHHIQARQ